ncbi:MAG TPA: hypothetical protein VGB07_03655, partial [Blastocatellia bacterium]
TNADSDSNANSDTNADSDANSDTNTNSDADANSDTNSDTNAKPTHCAYPGYAINAERNDGRDGGTGIER